MSSTLYAQVSTNEVPVPSDNTVTQSTVNAAAETPVNGDVAVSSLSPTGTPFNSSPYPIILEKMPFGTPPDPTVLNAAATTMDEAKMKVEQQKLAETFSWTAINITPDGKTAIGFTDLSAKPPANYYMTVGESANNWTVLEADYTSETATIEKGDDANKVRISLKFGNKSPIAPTTPGASPTSPPPLVAPAITLSGHSPDRQPGPLQPIVETHVPPLSAEGLRLSPTRSHSSLLTSYRDRLNERLKVQENQRQETDRKQKEELSKIVTDALRKQQEEASAAATQQQQGEGQVQQIETPVQ
ncbi:MAG: hypothetical protein WCP12_11835 [bacterium]